MGCLYPLVPQNLIKMKMLYLLSLQWVGSILWYLKSLKNQNGPPHCPSNRLLVSFCSSKPRKNEKVSPPCTSKWLDTSLDALKPRKMRMSHLLVPQMGWWHPRPGSACSGTGWRRSASSPCCRAPRVCSSRSIYRDRLTRFFVCICLYYYLAKRVIHKNYCVFMCLTVYKYFFTRS